MPPLSTIGVALWPGLPKPQVTAMTMCRQSLCIAAGTADGGIWLWRLPQEWHLFPKMGTVRRTFPGEDIHSGGGMRPLALLCGQHEVEITALVAAFEGKHHVLFSADASGCMCVWRLEDGVCLKTSSVLSWGPRAMVNVSCKGKSLIACCGPSPDIEVIEMSSMKRIVRLFGHGDWCTDLCVRPREALMELDIQSSREPSIYSLDQGGTLCVWLAERTCSAQMVGWVPSVQCHRVAVSCPTRLVLDKHCAALMVVGRDATARYRLGRDHRLADKATPPVVFSFSDPPSGPNASANAETCEDSPSHSATAATVSPTAPAARRPETAAQRRAKRLAAASERIGGICRSKSQMPLSHHLSRIQGVLAPGGDCALVWRPHDALLLLRNKGCGNSGNEVDRLVSCAALRVTAMCSDSSGWFALASDSGDVRVWSADTLVPAPHLSAASSLRSRHAVGGDSSSAVSAAEPVIAGAHSQNSAEWKSHAMSSQVAIALDSESSSSAPAAAAAVQSNGNVLAAEDRGEDGDKSNSVGSSCPVGYGMLSTDWTFQGEGWLLEAFYTGQHLRRDLAAVAVAEEAAWVQQGGEMGGRDQVHPSLTETSVPPALSLSRAQTPGETATVSIVYVEGVVPLRGGVVDSEWAGGSRRRGQGSSDDNASTSRGNGPCRTPTGVYWVVGFSCGSVSVMVMPSLCSLLRLDGHKAAVLSLLWVDGEDVLVSGGADGSIVVWDMPHGALRHRFTHSSSPVQRLIDLGLAVDMFLKDACVLFSLAGDGSVLVFSAKGGDDGGGNTEGRHGQGVRGSGKASAKSVFLLSGHNQKVVNVFWAPRHHYLYAQTCDAQLYVWLLHSDQPAQLLRRGLSPFQTFVLVIRLEIRFLKI